ncbi:hypothetical protein ACFL6I_01075 [candidate division KSB1 bacterium]
MKEKNGRLKMLLINIERAYGDTIAGWMKKKYDVEAVYDENIVKDLSYLSGDGKPDIIIIENSAQSHDFLSDIRSFKRRFPKTKIVSIAAYINDQTVLKGLDSGIDGFLVKPCSKKHSVMMVEEVLKGNSYICPEINKNLAI